MYFRAPVWLSCLMTSYIPLSQRFESRWRHASKNIEWWTNINIKPVWVVWLSPAGLRWFHRVFPSCTAEKYPGFPASQDSPSKCVYRSRTAWSEVDSISSVLCRSIHDRIADAFGISLYPIDRPVTSVYLVPKSDTRCFDSWLTLTNK